MCILNAPEPPQSTCEKSPSPIPPSPEPISPLLKQRQYGSTTYRLGVHIMTDAITLML